MRLTGAMLFVKDLPRMKLFYRDTLGLGAIAGTETDTYVEFDAGAAKFALHSIPPESADGIEIAAPPHPRENHPLKLRFALEDVAAERQRLSAMGVTMVEHSWGGCDGIDPEGNVFGIDPAL